MSSSTQETISMVDGGRIVLVIGTELKTALVKPSIRSSQKKMVTAHNIKPDRSAADQ